MGLAAALYAAAFGASDAGNFSARLWQSLYFPALALQAGALMLALALGAASVDAERNRKTWDKLRATEAGAGLALRARWLGILYRLRAPIAAILLLRLLLALAALVELSAFGGHYVQMLSAGAGAAPAIGDWRLGLLLIALGVALSLAQPLAIIAAAAALGLFLSVTVAERLYSALLQIALAAIYVALLLASAAGAAEILQGRLILSDAAQFAVILLYSSYGDWGLLLAQLGSLGQVWARVPAGAYISVGMAALLLIQTLLADGLMALAERIAERRG